MYNTLMKEKYVYYVYSPVKSHTTNPNLVHRDLRSFGFSSLYAVTAEDAAAIESAGTTAGFKGSVWNEKLWLDFDSYEAADAAERRLKEMGYAFSAYDSGGRGVHFGIVRDALPSHLLPAQDKAWVTKNFPDADASIYTHLHLFRVEGTRHETGGRVKRLVYEQRGEVLTLPPWKKEAGVYGTSVNYDGSSGGVASVFRCFRVMSNSVPTKVGERHPTYVKLVHALRDDAGASASFARAWVGEVNKMAEEPYSDEHLDKLVRDLYK